jgi:sugar porter (SP) family MFS transporter
MPLYNHAAIVVAVGGYIFGYAYPVIEYTIRLVANHSRLETGTIGPITAMSTFTASFGHLSSTIHGLVVSSILIGGSVSGLFAGNISDIYGRTATISVGAFIFGIGATLECASFQLGLFITGRVIAGIGEGIFLGNLIVYVCEITPARRRGPLCSVIQLMIQSGIASGYFISFGTARIKGSSASWRIPLAFQALVSFSFAAACLTLPPSPRWLLAKGRKHEAISTLGKLGLATSELEEMIAKPSAEASSLIQATLLGSIRSNFRDMTKVFSKDARKQTALACFMMAFQQFSGIDGVLYYAPLLFQQAGLKSEEASFLASGVSALVMLAATIPASIYADHWGRRMSVVAGGLVLATCMLVIGSLYASNCVHGDYGVARWVVIVAIYLFGVAFSVSWAIGIRIYSSEIQPAETRAGATSLAQSANWVSPKKPRIQTATLLILYV